MDRARILALALLAAYPATLPAQRPPAGFAADRLARIDRLMQQYVDSGKIAWRGGTRPARWQSRIPACGRLERPRDPPRHEADYAVSDCLADQSAHVRGDSVVAGRRKALRL